MFDAMKLLGSIMQGQTSPATAGRFDMAQAFAPQSQPQQASGAGLGTFGAGALGAAGGALLGDRGPGLVGGSLLAIVGNIAFKALESRMSGGATAQPAVMPQAMPTAGIAPPTSDAQRKATLLIRAMIQSAKADGNVDPVEMKRIMGKVEEHGHDPSAQAFVSAEMAKPIDLPALCRDVTSPQEGIEVYAASLMVLDLDSQAERDYLEDLAQGLGIAPQVSAQVRKQLGVAV